MFKFHLALKVICFIIFNLEILFRDPVTCFCCFLLIITLEFILQYDVR